MKNAASLLVLNLVCDEGGCWVLFGLFTEAAVMLTELRSYFQLRCVREIISYSLSLSQIL